MVESYPSRVDQLTERMTRQLAQHSSRRSFITRIARIIIGGMALPLLPVSRIAGKTSAAAVQTNDPTACDYWRYCAIDGYVCSCCGGGPSTCPPGTFPSPTSWVGSCLNPDDGQTYLISYRDCCGKDSCGRCLCMQTEGEMPVYRPQLNHDIVWCFGAPNMVYNCSGAALIGRVSR